MSTKKSHENSPVPTSLPESTANNEAYSAWSRPGSKDGQISSTHNDQIVIDVIQSDGSKAEGPASDGTQDEMENVNHLSFRAVKCVDVRVRGLSISVDLNSSKFLKLPGGKKKDTGLKELKILDNISADMPAGRLMAIIGGSGSGKVGSK